MGLDPLHRVIASPDPRLEKKGEIEDTQQAKDDSDDETFPGHGDLLRRNLKVQSSGRLSEKIIVR